MQRIQLEKDNTALKAEIKRYLGYQSAALDPQTDQLVESCLKELSCAKSGLFAYDVFPIAAKKEGILIADSGIFLTGDDIAAHLKGCKKAAVMAATLGPAVDYLIYKYNKTDLSRALVLDACATACIEAVCDRAQAQIAQVAKKEGFQITPRFSPGYGDLPILLQSDFLRLLRAEKRIGLTATKESVLIPSKSVTAVIGFTSHPAAVSCTNRCGTCKNYETCLFKRRDA